MAIDLSALTFTDADDIVPASGIVKIVNSGIANTLGGNDIITSSAITADDLAGIENNGQIDTGDSNDLLTGNAAGTAYYGMVPITTISSFLGLTPQIVSIPVRVWGWFR